MKEPLRRLTRPFHLFTHVNYYLAHKEIVSKDPKNKPYGKKKHYQSRFRVQKTENIFGALRRRDLMRTSGLIKLLKWLKESELEKELPV